MKGVSLVAKICVAVLSSLTLYLLLKGCLITSIFPVAILSLIAIRHNGREWLSGVDAIEFNCDEKFLTNVHGVCDLGGRITAEELKDIVENKFAVHRRLRQRVVSTILWPYWADVESFDINDHVEVIKGVKSQQQIEEFLSQEMSRPLNLRLAPWKFFFIEQYRDEDHSAFIMKFHHCLGDGVVMAKAAFAMTSLKEASPTSSSPSPQRRPGKRGGLLHSVSMLPKFVKALLKLLLLPADPMSPFKRAVPVQRRAAAWSEEYLPLSLVKSTAATLGTSINDVLMGLVTSALRQYAKSHNLDLDALSRSQGMQSAMWVSLRPLEYLTDTHSPQEFGNYIGACYTKLPFHLQDPVKLVRDMKGQIDELKTSPEPYVAYGLLVLMGYLPLPLARFMWKNVAFKVTASISTLPGPRMPLRFASQTLTGLMFHVPVTGTIAMLITAFTYNGRVSLGINTDADVIPDPAKVVHLFHQEVRALASQCNVTE
eukprot:GILJ01006070.1.p1 GENE.GILJ01006070.1~~GILJ01006070.1.p1  ORF type:complete len:484 (-),score=72.99 GILJ01006070.1:189-1640(-)